jgi:signal transduction histidine kinase
MDELAKLFDPTPAARPSLRGNELRDNETRALRGTIAALKARALHEQKTGAAERDRALLLREANQHLVLAAFEAEDSRTAAVAAIKRQTVFLAMLAHELRNPMASIAVANTIMSNMNTGNARMVKLVAIVGRQAAHLLRLVDDLLDASRISTGKISLQTRVIRLDDVIDGAIEAAQPFLTVRRQSLARALPLHSVAIVGDTVRLAQLFSNLIINASKFSAPGTAIVVSAQERDGVVAVSVKDQGKGIAPQFHSHIFDLFAQGEDDLDHPLTGGLGVGLSLVKTIAEMHGGSVRVVSEGAGHGSEFIVCLPLSVKNAERPA